MPVNHLTHFIQPPRLKCPLVAKLIILHNLKQTMPLRTAEALIAAPDLGSGGLQSLSVLNPPSLSDHPDDIQTEFTSLDIDEKAKNVDGELSHAQVVFMLNREYLERCSRKAKASAKNLADLASMARPTFIHCIYQIYSFTFQSRFCLFLSKSPQATSLAGPSPPVSLAPHSTFSPSAPSPSTY